MAQTIRSVNNPPTFKNALVAQCFASYPEPVREKLIIIRQLIIDVAAETDGVGVLEETLKWGQPSYLTSQTKSGSTIRIGKITSQQDAYAVFFHCQTTLIDSFREIYADAFNFVGNRAIVFGPRDKVPIKKLSHCIQMALTYYINKRKRKR